MLEQLLVDYSFNKDNALLNTRYKGKCKVMLRFRFCEKRIMLYNWNDTFFYNDIIIFYCYA